MTKKTPREVLYPFLNVSTINFGASKINFDLMPVVGNSFQIIQLYRYNFRKYLQTFQGIEFESNMCLYLYTLYFQI